MSMNASEVFKSIAQVWHDSPGVLLLLLLGIVGVLISVVDTWRYRRKHKRKRQH